jgi:hypothetical protein
LDGLQRGRGKTEFGDFIIQGLLSRHLKHWLAGNGLYEREQVKVVSLMLERLTKVSRYCSRDALRKKGGDLGGKGFGREEICRGILHRQVAVERSSLAAGTVSNDWTVSLGKRETIELTNQLSEAPELLVIPEEKGGSKGISLMKIAWKRLESWFNLVSIFRIANWAIRIRSCIQRDAFL